MKNGNIAVHIPKEIRNYKEKLVAGLDARKLIACIAAGGICVPLYWFGRNYISEDILSWIVIAVAAPIVSFGFVKYNGMPFEKVLVTFVSFFLLPTKRLFATENAWRIWEEEYDNQHEPKSFWEKKAMQKYEEQAGLEKAYLMQEAEDKGLLGFDPDKAELLTVSKPGDNSNKPPKKNKKKDEEKRISELQKKAESILRKQSEDSEYVLTRREFNTLKRWKAEQVRERKTEIEKGKKAVQNANKKMVKRRKAKSVLPKTVQKSIPFVADYEEGLFEVQPGKYSKMYRLKDINYTLSEQELREGMFIKWAEFLNYFEESMNIGVIIDNRIVSREEQENKVFNKMNGKNNDKHRVEYNKVLRSKIIQSGDDIRMEKYITVTINAKSPIEALLRFHKVDLEVVNNLRKCGSNGEVVSTEERLEYLHDKFRKGHEGELNINFPFIKKQGISSKDYIAPTMFDFEPNYLKIDDGYYRTMFLNNLPSSLSDEFLGTFTDNDFPVVTTITFKPEAQDKALKLVRHQLTSVETDKIKAEQRAVRAGYSPETIPHNIKEALPEAEQFKTDLTSNNQKLFYATITCMVYGETLEELEEHCKTLAAKARVQTCALQILRFQQEQGFRLTLPFGYNPNILSCDRSLTTESSAIFIPFKVQEMFQPGGYYYGLHCISKNLVVCNRLKMATPSGFVLGCSGSGKSFATKREILNVILHDDETGVLIIDPENEYGDFARAFGGEVIKISSESDIHINPMEMEEDYGLDEDDDVNTVSIVTKKSKAIKKKSEYMMSIVERMISKSSSSDTTTIEPQQKTIIDQCVIETYKEYLDANFDKSKVPTLIDFQKQLDIAADKEKNDPSGIHWAQDIASAVAYYTRGSLDVFSHHSNVDLNNRFIVFNVRDLGEQLKQIALIIVFDFIWNRMIMNKNQGVRTYCYCDEIHVMFRSYYSAYYLSQFYKRGRKYGMCITGITQNVTDLLKSEMARGMIANSQFIMMLNQFKDDADILATMLDLSENERQYIFNVQPGAGSLFAEGLKVPFFDEFPKESYLYKLMSTNFGEEMDRKEVEKRIAEIMKTGSVPVPDTDIDINKKYSA